MLSIAEFTLPAADFPLGAVFEDRPDVTLELDRVVPGGDTVMPYFWVHDATGELGRIGDVFASQPELRAAILLEDLGDKGLFRAEWDPESLGIMAAIAETGVTVLAASGSASGWTFELRAASGDQLSAFQEYCEDHGIGVTLARLSHLSTASDGDPYDLTPAQREALLLAYEAGYYDDPRATDLESLADELDISRQAVAARLRRGYRNLIESTVAADDTRSPRSG